MKPIHRLLTLYTGIVVLFVILFAFVVYFASPTPSDILNMALSIVLFSLIPFGIIYLIWTRHRH
jgi:hypothetical protein